MKTTNFLMDEDLEKNYDIISKILEFDKTKIKRTKQTHTDNVETIENFSEAIETDGIITNKTDYVLLTTSADCTSFLLYDPVKKVIGSIHSGWRGTYKEIIKKAIEKMQNEYETKLENVICCICPSIRKCCFEVKEDVETLFKEKFENAIIKNNGKTYIDTVKINIDLLKNIGLKEENIIDSNICTMCNQNKFHSYRAHKESTGRNAAIITRKMVTI